MTKKKVTSNFGDVIRDELASDPQLAQEVAEEFFHASVAREVYNLRKEAGLTQKEMAELVGTHQTVISRIEDADYDGHSLSILLRIAFALKKELNVEFVDPPTFGDDDVILVEESIEWPNLATWKWPANANLNGAGTGLAIA